MTMQNRTLADGSQVSLLSLGSWHIHDRIYLDESVDLFKHSIDQGVNLFDFGVYDGPSPRSLGERLPVSHTDVIFARVLAMAKVPRESFKLQLKAWLLGYPERSLKSQVDLASQRTGLEYFDLLSVGQNLYGVDWDDVVGEISDLIDAGRIGGWGTCTFSATAVAEADAAAVRNEVARPGLAQLKYSVSRRSIAEGAPYRELFETTDVRLQASDVLEGGYLAGRVPDREIGSDPGGIRQRIIDSVPEIAAVAEGFGITTAQASLGFAFANPLTTNLLMGCSRIEQVDAAIAAADFAQEHGSELRAQLEHLCAERDLDPAAA